MPDRGDPIRGGRPAGRSIPIRVACLLAGTSAVLTLLLLELALTVIGYEYVPMSIRLGRGADDRSFHVFDDSSFVYDPDLIWRPRRLDATFNEQGYRGSVLASVRRAGEIRLVALGDSNTLGWAGEDGANWPSDLQARIRTAVANAVVVNAGVWGYSSFQGVRRFRQTLPFEPDLVLVCFGSNDAQRVTRPDREYAASPVRESGLGRLLTRFHLGNAILAAGDALSRSAPDELRPRVTLEEFRENLATIVQDARSHGGSAVLLTRPYVGSIDSALWWKNWGADYNVATVEVARDLDVPVVDLYSAFKNRPQYFADESHFTAEGHALAADLIFDSIQPWLERRSIQQ